MLVSDRGALYTTAMRYALAGAPGGGVAIQNPDDHKAQTHELQRPAMSHCHVQE